MEASRDPDDSARMRILAVAFEPAELSALPRHIRLPGAVIVSQPIDKVRAIDWTAEDAPSFVISPLVTGLFDAQDLASLLAEQGFRGRYIAVANSIAEPQVIRSDVERVAPSLHFEVVDLNRAPPLRAV